MQACLLLQEAMSWRLNAEVQRIFILYSGCGRGSAHVSFKKSFSAELGAHLQVNSSFHLSQSNTIKLASGSTKFFVIPWRMNVWGGVFRSPLCLPACTAHQDVLFQTNSYIMSRLLLTACVKSGLSDLLSTISRIKSWWHFLSSGTSLLIH